MPLPNTLDPGNLGDFFKFLWTVETLARAVVDDDNLGLDRKHVGRGSRDVVPEAVVRDLIEAHRPELVHRACQRHFFIPGEIAHVEEFELAVTEQEASGTRILALVW